MTRDDVIKASVTHVNDASKRSRYAFLATIAPALVIFITAYNFYFSWYRTLPTCDPPEKVPAVLKELLTQWLKTHWVNISVLGVQVGVADVSVIGALALLITVVWYFFTVRREYSTTLGLLKQTQDDDPETKRYVYFGIISGLVFVTASEDDAARSIRDEGREATPYGPARFVLFALRYLPFLCTLAIALAEAWSLTQPSPIRCNGVALWDALDWYQRARAVSMIGVSFVTTYLLLGLATRIGGFERQMQEALRFYARQEPLIPDPMTSSRHRPWM